MSVAVLTISARKGGVGKTTLTYNLSAALAERGLRVLMIDMDSQGSLSRVTFGPAHVEKMHPGQTMAGLFDPQYDPEPHEVIQATSVPNVSIVTACDRLESFNHPDPVTQLSGQFVVRRFVEEVSNDFDACLIDTGPNTQGLLAWSALTASDGVLVPVVPDAFGAQSIIHMQRLVEQVQTKANPKLRILGYLINCWQKNAVCLAYEQTVRSLQGGQVLMNTIPLQAVYREALAERKPIVAYKPKVAASKVVRAVAVEVVERLVGTSQATKEAA
jgi:chromosome partitioning protein